jgi:hypothetical protein
LVSGNLAHAPQQLDKLLSTTVALPKLLALARGDDPYFGARLLDKLLLGSYEPGAPKGFVVSKEDEYRRVYDEEPLEDEAPWEFHAYDVEGLPTALRNTFVRHG